jgi:glycosyltransferase involved in cell wall biosynthesis
MKIVQITPGAGTDFYCDNCLRDGALVLELRRRGHDTLMVPLYLPMAAEGTDPSQGVPVFFGGINVYLQQKSALFRRTPRWVDRVLDSPRLLRWVARRAAMTKASDLGEPTLSMLRGEEGRQVKELDRLVEWLRAEGRPDVVCLSNALLVGLVRRLKAELGVPVVCLLQDEDSFLDALPEPHRTAAWKTVAGRAAEVDAFVAVSHHYRQVMAARLVLDPHRVHVVHIGIDTAGYEPAAAKPSAPTVGYLGQLSRARGLDTLVEAFLALRAAARWPGLGLRIAGGQTPADQAFVAAVRRRLAESGAERDVEFLPALDRAGRQEFLRSLSVLSAPARQAEAFGVFILEALASGVPLVLSRVGAYPELLEATGGGRLVEPDDAAGLAAEIEDLLAHPDEARAIGARGRRVVLDRFHVRHMADGIMEVFEKVVAGR